MRDFNVFFRLRTVFRISFDDTKHGDKLEVGEVCAGYTNDCKPQNNLCHLCPSAVTEVLSDRCGGVIMRYCKDITCGQKGAPACIRGAKASEYKGPVCIPGSPLGFCQKPYKVFCENGELICR